MIKMVTIINEQDEVLEIDLTNPYKSGFALISIDGIGPEKANINMSDLATNDGGIYNSSRKPPKNINIALKYIPHPTIEDTRYISYKFFPVKQKIRIRITTDKRCGEIEGIVESNEATIFSKSTGSKISVMCPKPYFKAWGPEATQVTTFKGVDPEFYFPFSNEHDTEPQLIVGTINANTRQNIFYKGDTETGMRLIITSYGEIGDVTIFNVKTHERIFLERAKIEKQTGKGICYGDIIVIDTNIGKKGITLKRDGVTTNILNIIPKDMSWMRLKKGDNLISYITSSGSEYLDFRIENDVYYEGM